MKGICLVLKLSFLEAGFLLKPRVGLSVRLRREPLVRGTCHGDTVRIGSLI